MLKSIPALTPITLAKRLLLILALIVSASSCRNVKCLFNPSKCNPGLENAGLNSVVQPGWLKWNFYFGSDYDSAARMSTIQDYAQYLNTYVKMSDPSNFLLFRLSSCPCDPSLATLDATFVGGSGTSIPPPPNTNPKPGPSGDFILSQNIEIAKDSFESPIFIPTIIDGAFLQKGTDGRILAIIDTGLDTTAFAKDIRPFLWKDALSVNGTIFDVLPDHFPYSSQSLQDSSISKHGTAVTAIAMSQINYPTLPKIMAIKAFDENEKGSIFSVSCGLSYAIQNHVDCINASWGFYSVQGDSVLLHYLNLAAIQQIPIVAAAGNTPGIHIPSSICGTALNSSNNLPITGGKFFFPACYSRSFSNIISVDQLNLTSPTGKFIPCNYQNYGNTFITTGVFNPVNCCTFNIKSNALDGSSFATPVVTGILLSNIFSTKPVSYSQYIDGISKKYTTTPFTRNGNYFEYISQFR